MPGERAAAGSLDCGGGDCSRNARVNYGQKDEGGVGTWSHPALERNSGVPLPASPVLLAALPPDRTCGRTITTVTQGSAASSVSIA